ncbi:MAG: flagellar basal body P-ring protein FlgI [Nitrospinota bacterium]
MKKNILALLAAVITIFMGAVTAADAARVKDITTVRGIRTNHLIGYGLMVGLKNSGDRSYKSPFTAQTLISMLKRLGTTIDIRQLTGQNIGVSETRHLRDVRIENVAAVMVTASLPPFATPGQIVDVSVASLGDAKSLEGGTLLLTPLKAANGEVYAVAQGTLAPRARKRRRRGRAESVPTSGRIPNGGLVEKAVNFDFSNKSKFDLLLNSPDFSTANAIVTAVNEKFGDRTAKGKDAGTIELNLPRGFRGNPFGFISEVESIGVKKDSLAKVVLDESSGTIVIGEFVEVNNAAISIGDITLEIRRRVLAADTSPTRKEKLNVVSQNTDIKELVDALNAIGVSPQDLVAIFRSLRAAGALNAKLEIL